MNALRMRQVIGANRKWSKYRAIYADPRWSIRDWDFATLAKLPIRDLAADDCVLFVWASDPLLARVMDLIRAWGFEYKTVAFYWVKLKARNRSFFTGPGHWTRANPEQCLLATRGQPW